MPLQMAPPPAVQSYMVPHHDPSRSQAPPHGSHAPPPHGSQYPPAYAPNVRSQPPPAHPSAYPPPQQHFAQPSFPPHFAPPSLTPRRSSVVPPATPTFRPSAHPPAADPRDAEELGPPPNLIATCLFLGGPLLVATMVVALLALR